MRLIIMEDKSFNSDLEEKAVFQNVEQMRLFLETSKAAKGTKFVFGIATNL